MLRKIILLGWLSTVFLSACSQPGATPVPMMASTPTAFPAGSILPHSLYFLRENTDGIFQVWQVESDGTTNRQVTNEPEGIEAFEVSSHDGKVVVLSENRLILIDSDGSNRTVLVNGGTVDDESTEYLFTKKLNRFSWSPDGNFLAYGLNGIHIFRISDHSDQYVISNIISEDADGGLHPTELYSPLSWSPDGTSLLLEVGSVEGGSLAVFHLSTGSLVQLGDEGIACCQPVWSPESDSVLVANPALGILPSGLWRYDAETGVVTELINDTGEDGTLNFASWPLQLPNGELRYFFNNMAAFPEGEIGMVMVFAASDGVSERSPIRTEYWINYEVLWAEDGSLAVVVQPATGVPPAWPRTGPILLIPATSEPIIPLAVNGYHLRWGP